MGKSYQSEYYAVNGVWLTLNLLELEQPLFLSVRVLQKN